MLNTGLSYLNYGFDDNYAGQLGQLAPQNACLLALYGNKGSYQLKPNANTYAVSGGRDMLHWNGVGCSSCSNGKKCMNGYLMEPYFDFSEFSIGDGCNGPTDTDPTYTALHCKFDVSLGGKQLRINSLAKLSYLVFIKQYVLFTRTLFLSLFFRISCDS